jgi:hypothetical protein
VLAGEGMRWVSAAGGGEVLATVRFAGLD